MASIPVHIHFQRGRCIRMTGKNQVVFYAITIPRITKRNFTAFLLIEGVAGMALYVGCKAWTSSELAGIVGSIAGVAGIKKLVVRKKA